MAPNGTSRKSKPSDRSQTGTLTDQLAAPAPATNGKPTGINFVTKDILSDNFTDTDRKKPLKIKDEVAKRLPKATKPGNWDSEITGGKEDSTLSRPRVNRVPSDIAKAFSTGRPLADRADVVKCNHCKRAVLRHRAKAHVEDCISKKQEKQRKKKEAKDARDAAARKEREGESESEEEGLTGSKTARKTDGPDGEMAGKSKKRKAEDAESGPKKKKKKDEPKAKAPRPKAPVDVEKQCGVELPQGGQCARSLTCKSHSMGAKRAVPGRSAPYDKLLAEYQRKNQAKLQSKQVFEAYTVIYANRRYRSSIGVAAFTARRRARAFWTYRFG